MRGKVFGCLMSLCLLAALAPQLLGNPTRVQVEVPFEFSVGQQTLPAGKYLIEQAGPSGLLVIKNEETGRRMKFLANFGKPMLGDVRVAFRRYGERHFLAEVKHGLHGVTFVIPPTRAEREASTAVALDGSRVEWVTLSGE